MEILRVENLTCSYESGGNRFRVLKDISFSVEAGDFIAIEGPSGSGKSTLFYVLGCLLAPDYGRVILDGQELTKMSPNELAFLRNQKVGFIFQQFHLLPRASILSNILLPTMYPCEVASTTVQDTERAKGLAETLGLEDQLEKSPNQLSGGQQQRVAIARALMKNVKLILADEPTGNLDSKNAAQIMELLRALNREGKTIILITHDAEVARRCKKVWKLRDGVFTEHTQPADPNDPIERTAETHQAPEALHLPSPSPSAGFKRGVLPFVRHYARLAVAALPLALENLRRNKTRAFLTMVGVSVGIAAVLAMITFGQFVKARILQSYQDLGVNTLSVNGWRDPRLKATDRVDFVFDQFSWDKDVLPLKQIFPSIKRMSPVLMSWGNTITYGGFSVNDDVRTLGITPEYLPIANRELRAGRAITPYHVESAASVCLIGAEIAEKLFNHQSAIGEIVFVTGNSRPAYPCRVIGVLMPQSTNKDWMKPNLEVLMPYTYFSRVHDRWDTSIHNFRLQLYPDGDIEKMSRAVKNFFIQKYGGSGEFHMGSDAILLAQMKKFLVLFTFMLATIALITLGVGGMGINNMMLVSISERLKEIGLRKAIGATDRSIRVQFLLESTLLSLISGLIGVILGFTSYEVIIYLTSKFVQKIAFEWIVDPIAMTVSVIAILVVGIASGIVPALKAERLQVIDALRSE